MFTLPKLSYDYNALEPHIDAKTMRLHHGKHHAGYVANLNKTLEGTKWADKSIEEVLGNVDKLPEDKRQAVINNGGGHANHTLFWSIMSPSGGGEPEGKLADMIKKSFGGFEEFKEKFSGKATTLFGSGWVFLLKDGKKLICKRHSFQNSPLMNGKTQILAIDVWEHAYYLKYQNRRADYVKAWWNVVNWNQVNDNFRAAS